VQPLRCRCDCGPFFPAHLQAAWISSPGPWLRDRVAPPLLSLLSAPVPRPAAAAAAPPLPLPLPRSNAEDGRRRGGSVGL
jgi:hypothetical protein